MAAATVPSSYVCHALYFWAVVLYNCLSLLRVTDKNVLSSLVCLLCLSNILTTSYPLILLYLLQVLQFVAFIFCGYIVQLSSYFVLWICISFGGGKGQLPCMWMFRGQGGGGWTRRVKPGLSEGVGKAGKDLGPRASALITALYPTPARQRCTLDSLLNLCSLPCSFPSSVCLSYNPSTQYCGRKELEMAGESGKEVLGACT